jgi:hypothetical protein
MYFGFFMLNAKDSSLLIAVSSHYLSTQFPPNWGMYQNFSLPVFLFIEFHVLWWLPVCAEGFEYILL